MEIFQVIESSVPNNSYRELGFELTCGGPSGLQISFQMSPQEAPSSPLSTPLPLSRSPLPTSPPLSQSLPLSPRLSPSLPLSSLLSHFTPLQRSCHAIHITIQFAIPERIIQTFNHTLLNQNYQMGYKPHLCMLMSHMCISIQYVILYIFIITYFAQIMLLEKVRDRI